MDRTQLIELAISEAVTAWRSKWSALVGNDHEQLVLQTHSETIHGLVAHSQVQWMQCKPRRDKLFDVMQMSKGRELRTIEDIFALLRLVDRLSLEQDPRKQSDLISDAREASLEATIASFDNRIECYLALPFTTAGVTAETALKLVRSIMES
jgi:hypothetical protein